MFNMDSFFYHLASNLVRVTHVLRRVQEYPFTCPLTQSAIRPELQLSGNEEDIINSIKQDVITSTQDLDLPPCRINAMIAALDCMLGCIHAENDEFDLAEEAFNSAFDVMIDDTTCDMNVLVKLIALNELGIVYFEESGPARAINCFTTAHELYLSFRSIECNSAWTLNEVLFDTHDPTSGTMLLQVGHLLSSFFLAMSHQLLGNHLQSAVFCFFTLQLQLDTGFLDYIDWALNVASLSQFFLEKNAFEGSRHLLYSANKILDDCQPNMLLRLSPDEQMVFLDTMKSCKAEIAKCHVSYCNNLLQISKDRLMDEPIESPPDPLLGLRFIGLEDTHENEVSCNFVLTFEDGLRVFEVGRRCIEEAWELYTLEDFATEHIGLAQDLSALYKSLCFFVDDDKSRIEYHKKRINLLTPLSNQLSKDHYIDILRELWFEIGECVWDIAEIRMTMDPNKKPMRLLGVGLHTFKKIIDSYPPASTIALLKIARQEDNWLQSHIFRAQFFASLPARNRDELVNNTNLAIKDCRFVLAYCDKWYPQGVADSTTSYRADCNSCHNLIRGLEKKLARYSDL